MFALIDCNNFYASCERLFRPDLHNKPLIVLSSNDGCVIARSNEAKALGIAMGVPYFQVKRLCQQQGVHVFSSNFALYGDLSNRVMSVIENTWDQVEIYSIDEAFLDLRSMPAHLHDAFCHTLQKQILKSTGIPTSIGIGQTKTLAKLANVICKKKLRIPVFNIINQREWLQRIDVGEVWGVGRCWQKALLKQGVSTAFDLATMHPALLKKQFNVVLQRTAMELLGVSCAGIGEEKTTRSIISSRSFGIMQSDFAPLAQAISAHCATAYAKLRSQHLTAQQISVFIRTNRFRDDLSQCNNIMQYQLVQPTDDLRLITRIAKLCMKKLFNSGFYYKKVGVCLHDLRDKSCQQLDLFDQPAEEFMQKTEDFMAVMDKINCKYGQHTIKLAAEGFSKPWAEHATMRSPRYTTQWSDLPIVRM
jgi:DNA polymerase V